MTSTNTYTVGKVMQLIPLNDEAVPFNIDFYLKAGEDFHFAIVDQKQLDEGSNIDFKQSDAGEVSGNIKSTEDLRSYYIGLKSLNDSTEISVSIAKKPPPPPPPPQQQQRPPSPPQQQMRPPPQNQQQQMRRPPPNQQQMRRPPPNQQQMRRPPPNQQQMRRPPPNQQQMRRPPPNQQQMRRPPQNLQNPQPIKLTRSNDQKKLAMYIGGGVAIIAIGFAIWYFFIRKKSKPTSDSASSTETSPTVSETVKEVSEVASDAGSELLSKLKSLPESRRSLRR